MKKAKACFADGGQISKADQMIADMNRKYGVSGNSQPAPPPVQQPAPRPAPQQQSRGLIGDAMNVFGNRAKQIDKAAGYADGGLIRDAGEYWANDNAEFEKRSPRFVDRVIRGINPITGFGSAMGAMHTAANNGDIPGMAMAGIQAIPAIGVLKSIPAAGIAKASVSPSIGRTAAALAGGGVINASADELIQERNKGYRNGGLIKGIGTPTSDSIPAKVQETGEPIKVSTDERIVSHAQGAVLERLAKHHGYDNLDAMLEAETGKPVGPTIKGGKKAAADGWSLDNNPDEYANAMQQQVLGRDAQGSSQSLSVGAGQAPTIYENGGLPTPTDRVTGSLPVANVKNESTPLVDGVRPWYAGASSADNRTGLEMERGRRAEATSAGVMNDPVKSALQYGVVGQNGTAQAPAQSPVHASNPLSAGVLSDYGNEGRGVPAPITKQNPSTIVDNQFTEGGKNYTVNPTSQDGIKRVTAQGTSPLYTNIDPQKAVSGLKDQMIGGDAASVNEGLARYANANKIRGEMIANRDKDIPAGGYAPSILADRSVEDNAALDAMRRSSMISNLSPSQQAEFNMSLSKLALQDKGQNLASDNARYAAEVQDKRAAGHDQVLMRGQDLNAQNEAARISGNPVDNQAKQLSLTQAQKIAQLQDSASAGDTKALSELKMRGIIKSPDDKWELGYRKTKDANTGLETQEPVVVTKDFGKQQQMTPQQEYQNAIASAKGDPAKIKLIQDRARQNGVIQ